MTTDPAQLRSLMQPHPSRWAPIQICDAVLAAADELESARQTLTEIRNAWVALDWHAKEQVTIWGGPRLLAALLGAGEPATTESTRPHPFVRVDGQATCGVCGQLRNANYGQHIYPEDQR